ncbi:hypothetical protein OG818_14535 [Streptomyces virginiae]|uniref:hypothetical protein n=1 Tax=Streptomyces virginiae TaxID=1961 RepID=UPI00225372DA|nr:hypothetical protein [Streptomyces virginiae]MCX4717019.1 hypothetical protein [Streptomyces virginiae]
MQRLEGNPIDGRSNRFTSGAAALTDTLAAALPSGTVQLGTPVTAIRAKDALVARIRSCVWDRT